MNIEDIPTLVEYLRARGTIAPAETPSVRKLEGGVSNRVMLVKPGSAPAFVVKQALQKLRVAVDWFCTPTRIEKEGLALQYLSELTSSGSIPRVLFTDSEQHLLAMEAVPEPHETWKQILLRGQVEQSHIEQFALLLGSIHSKSSQRRVQLERAFEDRSIYETLRLEPYYRYTAANLPESAAFIGALIADTLASRLALVHGDYSPKNILVHDDKLILLDCEVVHFGDPAFDLGFSMAHFLGKANHLKAQRTVFAEAAMMYWQTYSACIAGTSWATALEPRAVRHSLACSLARVAGRSPLEYLTPSERAAHKTSILRLLANAPTTMNHLVTRFQQELTCQ
jgi:tRNA A-37 threonylcarbamoyl transferase component Bud32